MQLIKMTAEEGNITVDASTGTVSSDFITYDIKATEGAINYNGTDYEGELKITLPPMKNQRSRLRSQKASSALPMLRQAEPIPEAAMKPLRATEADVWYN